MKFFSYDGETFAIHETEEEAKANAHALIESATDGSYDQEALDNICWGEIRGWCMEISRRTVEELDAGEQEDQEEAETLRKNGWDYTAEFGLVTP